MLQCKLLLYMPVLLSLMKKTNVIEGGQKELEKAIVNLHDALKELEDLV